MGNSSSTYMEKDTSMSPKTPKVTASPDGKGGMSTGPPPNSKQNTTPRTVTGSGKQTTGTGTPPKMGDLDTADGNGTSAPKRRGRPRKTSTKRKTSPKRKTSTKRKTSPKRRGRPRKTSPKRKMNLVGAGARIGRAGIAAGV